MITLSGSARYGEELVENDVVPLALVSLLVEDVCAMFVPVTDG